MASWMRNRTCWLAVAGAAVVAIGMAAPASAAGAPRPRAAALPSLRGGPASISQSTSFAGYQVDLPSSFPAAGYHATSTFVVPTISCADPTLTYPTGENEVLSLTVGSSFSAGLVLMSCSSQGAAPYYFPAAEVNNVSQAIPYTVKPGDRMTVKVAQTATSAKVTMHDVTGHWTAVNQNTGFFTPGGDAAEGFSNDSCGGPPCPIAAFSTATFRDDAVDGAALGTYTPGVDLFQYDMVDSSNNVEIFTGDLNSTGESFTETFVSST